MSKDCVIYCRVSSKKQEIDGNGLSSQEHRCTQKALELGYSIKGIFRDTITGSTMIRDDFQKMIDYCRKNKDTVIIFDDLKRFSRDTLQGIQAIQQIDALGCKVFCLNFPVDTTTPSGRMLFTVTLAASQFEKETNQIQVSQKSKARLEQGYWFLPAPVGYNRGKFPVPNEQAPIIKELLEDFSHNPDSISDFQVKLEKQGIIIKKLHNVRALLESPIYAGYLKMENCGIQLTKAVHTPIISLQTHLKIQDKLNNYTRSETYNTDNVETFFHKGWLECSECGKNLTYCIKSNGKKNPYIANYYNCKTQGCGCKGKTIRLDAIEDLILERLQNIIIDEVFLEFFKSRLETFVDQHKDDKIKKIVTIRSKIRNNDKKITDYTVKLLALSNATAIKGVEEMIENLDIENKKLKLELSSLEDISDEVDMKVKIEFILDQYKDLYSTYKKANANHKKALLHLILGDKIKVDLKTKYSTLVLSDLVQVLGGIKDPQNRLVDFEGIKMHPIIEFIECKYSVLMSLETA